MRRSSLSCDIEADNFAGVYRFSVYCAGKSNGGPWYTDDSRIRFARMEGELEDSPRANELDLTLGGGRVRGGRIQPVIEARATKATVLWRGIG